MHELRSRSYERWSGHIIVLALEIHICRNALREDKIDPQIYTEEISLWWSNLLDLHRG